MFIGFVLPFTSTIRNLESKWAFTYNILHSKWTVKFSETCQINMVRFWGMNMNKTSNITYAVSTNLWVTILGSGLNLPSTTSHIGSTSILSSTQVLSTENVDFRVRSWRWSYSVSYPKSNVLLIEPFPSQLCVVSLDLLDTDEAKATSRRCIWPTYFAAWSSIHSPTTSYGWRYGQNRRRR